jgi:RNA polymerase-interacting CarD/CdnL/TRCF family regulator
MVYESGSIVYEPFLGCCTVVASSQETILGVEQLFYQLQPPQGNATVKVPARQMASRGIRPLMTSKEMEGVLQTGAEASLPAQETYPQRLRRWTDRLRSGDHDGPVVMLREYQVLVSQGAKISPKESEMHETVQRSILQEIGAVLQISTEKASSRLNETVGLAL